MLGSSINVWGTVKKILCDFIGKQMRQNDAISWNSPLFITMTTLDRAIEYSNNDSVTNMLAQPTSMNYQYLENPPGGCSKKGSHVCLNGMFSG